VPCQDTPSNKFTYSARIEVDAPLRALMSAQTSTEGEPASSGAANRTQYDFKQPEPIPSYLLALAVGALESRRIGPRSHVWSEAAMVDAAAFEFAKTEDFIKAGEDVCGPYPWGKYDILLMPPSFPYGGMENSNLTYVTPTLLAGDRSLANVVAHEIAHSWFGNYVGTFNWESFWMNEGFTVFLERKIVKALYGKQHQDLHAQIGLNDLQKSVDRFGADHPFTCLCPRLRGVDPDDAFSSVPYEKGFNFLTYLENLIGGEAVMNPFLRAHCERFAHGTVSSEQWKPFFIDYMLTVAKIPQATLDQIDWDAWYNKPGMPPVANAFDQTLIKGSNELADILLAGGEKAAAVKPDALNGWDSAQQIILLERIIAAQKESQAAAGGEKVAQFLERLQAIDSLFHFTDSRNSEIRFRWLTLVIRQPGMEDRYPAVGAFLREQGRMKYVRPLFRDLYESGGAGREFGIKLFQEHGKQYHSIAQKMVAKDLNLA
jgi:leukotriene-A4 hydrolase